MTDIKTQVRQAAEKAFWNGGTYTPTMIQAAADAAALAALEGVQKAILDRFDPSRNNYQPAMFVLRDALAQFTPQPHPLLARLTALEQQQAELSKQIAAVRQEMEQTK